MTESMSNSPMNPAPSSIPAPSSNPAPSSKKAQAQAELKRVIGDSKYKTLASAAKEVKASYQGRKEGSSEGSKSRFRGSLKGLGSSFSKGAFRLPGDALTAVVDTNSNDNLWLKGKEQAGRLGKNSGAAVHTALVLTGGALSAVKHMLVPAKEQQVLGSSEPAAQEEGTTPTPVRNRSQSVPARSRSNPATPSSNWKTNSEITPRTPKKKMFWAKSHRTRWAAAAPTKPQGLVSTPTTKLHVDLKGLDGKPITSQQFVRDYLSSTVTIGGETARIPHGDHVEMGQKPLAENMPTALKEFCGLEETDLQENTASAFNQGVWAVPFNDLKTKFREGEPSLILSGGNAQVDTGTVVKSKYGERALMKNLSFADKTDVSKNEANQVIVTRTRTYGLTDENKENLQLMEAKLVINVSAGGTAELTHTDPHSPSEAEVNQLHQEFIEAKLTDGEQILAQAEGGDEGADAHLALTDIKKELSFFTGSPEIKAKMQAAVDDFEKKLFPPPSVEEANEKMTKLLHVLVDIKIANGASEDSIKKFVEKAELEIPDEDLSSKVIAANGGKPAQVLKCVEEAGLDTPSIELGQLFLGASTEKLHEFINALGGVRFSLAMGQNKASSIRLGWVQDQCTLELRSRESESVSGFIENLTGDTVPTKEELKMLARASGEQLQKLADKIKDLSSDGVSLADRPGLSSLKDTVLSTVLARGSNKDFAEFTMKVLGGGVGEAFENRYTKEGIEKSMGAKITAQKEALAALEAKPDSAREIANAKKGIEGLEQLQESSLGLVGSVDLASFRKGVSTYMLKAGPISQGLNAMTAALGTGLISEKEKNEILSLVTSLLTNKELAVSFDDDPKAFGALADFEGMFSEGPGTEALGKAFTQLSQQVASLQRNKRSLESIPRGGSSDRKVNNSMLNSRFGDLRSGKLNKAGKAGLSKDLANAVSILSNTAMANVPGHELIGAWHQKEQALKMLGPNAKPEELASARQVEVHLAISGFCAKVLSDAKSGTEWVRAANILIGAHDRLMAKNDFAGALAIESALQSGQGGAVFQRLEKAREKEDISCTKFDKSAAIKRFQKAATNGELASSSAQGISASYCRAQAKELPSAAVIPFNAVSQDIVLGGEKVKVADFVSHHGESQKVLDGLEALSRARGAAARKVEADSDDLNLLGGLSGEWADAFFTDDASKLKTGEHWHQTHKKT